MKTGAQGDELVPAASRADLFSKYENSGDKIDKPGKTHPEIWLMKASEPLSRRCSGGIISWSSSTARRDWESYRLVRLEIPTEIPRPSRQAKDLWRKKQEAAGDTQTAPKDVVDDIPSHLLLARGGPANHRRRHLQKSTPRETAFCVDTLQRKVVGRNSHWTLLRYSHYTLRYEEGIGGNHSADERRSQQLEALAPADLRRLSFCDCEPSAAPWTARAFVTWPGSRAAHLTHSSLEFAFATACGRILREPQGCWHFHFRLIAGADDSLSAAKRPNCEPFGCSPQDGEHRRSLAACHGQTLGVWSGSVQHKPVGV